MVGSGDTIAGEVCGAHSSASRRALREFTLLESHTISEAICAIDPENPSTFSENEPIIPLRSTHDDDRSFGSILERDLRTMKENRSSTIEFIPPFVATEPERVFEYSVLSIPS